MTEANAKAKYLRISPIKMAGICKLVRGKDVIVAKTILLRSPQKSARLISKTLNSAIANAKNRNMNEKNLFIAKITADQGPSLKRWLIWSKGSSHPIRKRTTHLAIVLQEKEASKTKKTIKKKDKEEIKEQDNKSEIVVEETKEEVGDVKKKKSKE